MKFYPAKVQLFYFFVFLLFKFYTMTEEEIHVGKLIRNKLKEDGRSVSLLAKKIHCKRDNIYKIFDRTSVDTALLLRISFVLKTDFFICLSDFYQNTIPKIDIYDV